MLMVYKSKMCMVSTSLGLQVLGLKVSGSHGLRVSWSFHFPTKTREKEMGGWGQIVKSTSDDFQKVHVSLHCHQERVCSRRGTQKSKINHREIQQQQKSPVNSLFTALSLGKGLKRGGTQQRTSLLEFITQITCATYDDDDDEHYDDIYDDDYEHYDDIFHYWNSLSKSRPLHHTVCSQICSSATKLSNYFIQCWCLNILYQHVGMVSTFLH